MRIQLLVLIIVFLVMATMMYHGVASASWARTFHFDLEDFTFEHPMTVVNRSELEIVKERIRYGIEPQASAFAALMRDAEAALTFEPDPPDRMAIMGGYEPNSNLSEMRAWLWRNRTAAYASALAYAYTGETKYADKAAEILNAWAEANTVFTGRDRGLQLGSWFSGMLYAADLIYDYDGWTVEDRKRFETWWRTNVLPHVLEVMRERVNNWKDAGVLGVLAAAVVLEDRDLLAEGLTELKSYFYERRVEGGRDEAWKITMDEHGVYLPHEVERNEGVSGITYTAYTLTSAVQALEIARHAGFNLWHHRTPQGATIQDVIETFFLWNERLVPFPWHPEPNSAGNRQNTFENANNHFDVLPQITDWLATHRPVYGQQGDEYSTLNRGDIQPLTAPGGLRLQVVDGYDGAYTTRRLTHDLELYLLDETVRPASLTVNLSGAADVRLLPDDISLPFVSDDRHTRVDLSDVPADRLPIALRFVDARKHLTGIKAFRITSLQSGREIQGPVTLEFELVAVPESLGIEKVTIAVNSEERYVGDTLPSDFVINRGELSNGFHSLRVRVEAADRLGSAEETLRFHVLNTEVASPRPLSHVTHLTPVAVRTWLPPESIDHFAIFLNGEELWVGGPYGPDDLVIDTRSLPDGDNQITVRVTTKAGIVSEHTSEFRVSNWWRITDRFLPPFQFFGVLTDRSPTESKSDGWQYAEANPEHFFGDEDRLVRTADTTETLVWAANLLKQVRVVMYAKNLTATDAVQLSVSGDGQAWADIPFTVEASTASDSGWYQIVLTSEIEANPKQRLLRLQVLEGIVGANELQLGEVVMAGWRE